MFILPLCTSKRLGGLNKVDGGEFLCKLENNLFSYVGKSFGAAAVVSIIALWPASTPQPLDRHCATSHCPTLNLGNACFVGVLTGSAHTQNGSILKPYL